MGIAAAPSVLFVYYTYSQQTRRVVETMAHDSMLALLSYLSAGVTKERYLGMKIPPATLSPSYLGQAQAFANGLADHLVSTSHS